MTQKQRKKRKLHIRRLLACIAILCSFCAIVLYSLYHYSNPTLYGKWQSVSTDKIVEFHKDGTVTLSESTQEPTFNILSPHTMSYTVNGKVFEMYFNLEGRSLDWGMTAESVENFKRK